MLEKEEFAQREGEREREREGEGEREGERASACEGTGGGHCILRFINRSFMHLSSYILRKFICCVIILLLYL